MNKKSILIKKFKNKIQLLKKHNKYYYNLDQPKISDAQYDNLKNEILKLENENRFLKDLNLFKNIIGAPPSNKFKKVKHLLPMLSLSNAFDENDVGDFIKKDK